MKCLFFLKGCDYFVLFFSFSFFVSFFQCCRLCVGEKQGSNGLLFYCLCRGGKLKTQAAWGALITQNPKDASFHVHGSYGAVFSFLFSPFHTQIHVFLCCGFSKNNTVTLSTSCLPLNFSFLQIYMKTLLLVCVCFFFSKLYFVRGF